MILIDYSILACATCHRAIRGDGTCHVIVGLEPRRHRLGGPDDYGNRLYHADGCCPECHPGVIEIEDVETNGAYV